MDIEIGSVLTGKVTGITKFGAFVAVAPGKSGLVHISEISNTYVSEVSEHLTVGQEVSVKVIGTDNGKLNLSIKATLPPPERPAERPQRPAYTQRAPSRESVRSAAPRVNQDEPAKATFEDKLKRFMQDSDSKISGARGYDVKKTSRRKGK
jgi:S1 RNA binding domain protein